MSTIDEMTETYYDVNGNPVKACPKCDNPMIRIYPNSWRCIRCQLWITRYSAKSAMDNDITVILNPERLKSGTDS